MSSKTSQLPDSDSWAVSVWSSERGDPLQLLRSITRPPPAPFATAKHLASLTCLGERGEGERDNRLSFHRLQTPPPPLGSAKTLTSLHEGLVGKPPGARALLKSTTETQSTLDVLVTTKAASVTTLGGEVRGLQARSGGSGGGGIGTTRGSGPETENGETSSILPEREKERDRTSSPAALAPCRGRGEARPDSDLYVPKRPPPPVELHSGRVYRPPGASETPVRILRPSVDGARGSGGRQRNQPIALSSHPTEQSTHA